MNNKKFQNYENKVNVANSGKTENAKLTAKRSKKRKTGSLDRANARIGFLFVLPWVIGATIFLLYPLFTSFWYSLNNIRITPIGKSFKYVQHGNYTQILLADADFPRMLIDYIGMVVLAVPIILVFALIVSLLLNEKIKLKGFYRMIFFLPVIIVSGPVMGMLVGDGAVSLDTVDVQGISAAVSQILPSWMADPISSVFANLIMILWYSGVPILIYIAGLQKIDKSMYEAAKIDGASAWENFWKITLPSIKPMILLNAIFTIVFISNNEQNNIINLIRNNMFSGTKERGYGYASAMAWIYSLVVVVIIALFALFLTTRKDKYEKKVKAYERQQRKQKRAVKRIRRRNARFEKQKARKAKG